MADAMDVLDARHEGQRPMKVVLAKVGLDGHDRGVKVVARALRDAGMEVIYLGIRCSIDQIVQAALEEDAQAVGLSNLSAALTSQCRQVIEALDAEGASDVVVFAGGTVLPEDRAAMEELGVAAVFGPGSSTDEIVACLTEKARRPNDVRSS